MSTTSRYHYKGDCPTCHRLHEDDHWIQTPDDEAAVIPTSMWRMCRNLHDPVMFQVQWDGLAHIVAGPLREASDLLDAADLTFDSIKGSTPYEMVLYRDTGRPRPRTRLGRLWARLRRKPWSEIITTAHLRRTE